MSKKAIQIQKGLNVNKLIILLLILFNTSLCFSQKNISGTYSIEYKLKYFNSNYTFYENGIFESKSSGDVGISNYGKGHYLIKKDSLFLNYDLTELEADSYHKVKHYKNSDTQIKIELKLFDLYKNQVEEVEVLNDVINTRERPDKEGKIIYYFPNKRGWVTFRVLNYWFGAYEFTLNTNLNSEVEVYLRRSQGVGIKNSIYKYKILEFNEDHIKFEKMIWKKIITDNN